MKQSDLLNMKGFNHHLNVDFVKQQVENYYTLEENSVDLSTSNKNIKPMLKQQVHYVEDFTMANITNFRFSNQY